MVTPRTYTHPDVLTRGVREGWADPETDPTRIDWPARQAAAAIPFAVVDGRPVNPCARTGIRYGRNQLGHWGEALAADALVSATTPDGRRWIVMVERADGHGWALPGGHVEPGEDPAAAAVRELREETGLVLPDASWRALSARYVPDPRASDEAWMVTVLCTAHLGTVERLPAVAGGDDAARAAWVCADTFDVLAADLATTHKAGCSPLMSTCSPAPCPAPPAPTSRADRHHPSRGRHPHRCRPRGVRTPRLPAAPGPPARFPGPRGALRLPDSRPRGAPSMLRRLRALRRRRHYVSCPCGAHTAPAGGWVVVDGRLYCPPHAPDRQEAPW